MPWLKIREDLVRAEFQLSAALAFVATIGLWGALTFTGIVSEVFLPSPIAIIKAFAPMLRPIDPNVPGLLESAMFSIWRVLVATSLSALVAVPLGLLMGLFTRIRALLNPICEPLRYLPVAAIVPLSIVWFGIGETQKIIVLFIGVIVYMLPLIIGAVDRVDTVYLNTGYTLGADRWQSFRHVVLPLALPSISEAIRVVNGIGWTYVILAEVVNANIGLGRLIQLSLRRGHMDRAFVAVIVILVIGIASDRLLAGAIKALYPWREATQ